MTIALASRPLESQAADALIVFIQNKKPLLIENDALKKLLIKQIKTSSFTGEALQISVFPTFGNTKAKNIILAGLGDSTEFLIEQLERTTAAAVRAGKKAGSKQFATAISTGLRDLDNTTFAHAVARGAIWGTYDFNTFKTKSAPGTSTFSLTFAGTCNNATAIRRKLNESQIEGEALLATADLANLPANHATPQKIASWATKMAKETGLTCSILNKVALQKENCNALLSVAAGSSLDAKIITLKYKGTNPKAKPIVLVGKTLTFDSGGISLKPGKNMSWMHYDKSGGMAVLATMKMVALIKPKTPVIGILTVAENMPDGGASRPGDIIKSRSGKTIEILNTDAEGRLALCDALDLALKHNPEAMVDIATLTGAVIIALGRNTSAVVGNNSELNQELVNAGIKGGERLWELPLWQEHKDDMKGTFADLQNIGKSGTAGVITGGAFLSEFVPDNIPWAHLDIAGTAWVDTPKPWMAPGASLAGARTLIEWIKGMG